MEDISMNFNSDEDAENRKNSEKGENEENFEVNDNESLEGNDNIIKYKSADYSLEVLIKKFKDLQIIKNNLSVQLVNVI